MGEEELIQATAYDIISIIDEEVEYAKEVSQQMTLGMLQIKELIIKEYDLDE